MECQECDFRSSVGFCHTCQKMLCEVCGAECTECGHFVCPEHGRETRSGKLLCPECQQARKKARSHHRATHAAAAAVDDGDDTSFSSLEGMPDVPGEEDLADEGTILAASAYRPKEPWQMCLGAGLTALIVILIVLFVPGFRTLAQPWVSIIVIFVSLLALFWAVVGLTGAKYVDERSRCFPGTGCAIVAIILALASIQYLPDRKKEIEIEMATEKDRMYMTPEELAVWRNRRLDKFGY